MTDRHGHFAGTSRCAAHLALYALISAVSVGSQGCAGPSKGDMRQDVPARPVTIQSPSCGSLGVADVLANIPDRECGFALVNEHGKLVLFELTIPPKRLAQGDSPRCGAQQCQYEGVATQFGPVILATVSGLRSEMADGALVGYVDAAALRFVDLWEGAGSTVVEDGTELGPAHALAPAVCGGNLAFFVEPRLPVGELSEVPAALASRQGWFDRRIGQWREGPLQTPSECVPVPLPLP